MMALRVLLYFLLLAVLAVRERLAGVLAIPR
jgi:hypothetical protein